MSLRTARPRIDWATSTAATPLRTAPTVSNAEALRSRPSAAWITVALVLSAYAGAVVANATTLARYPSGAMARALRPASTPSDVVSSSKLATLRRPLPPPLPSAAVIALRCSLQYGMYAP